MRKFVVLAAVAAFASATPAFAQDASGEARAEVHGGIAWSGGDEEAFAGVAAGYDFDLGDSAFVGVEGSVDKVLASGTDLSGSIGGRIGLKAGEKGKAYALGGYNFNSYDDAPYVGVGYAHKLSGNIYGGVEYRRLLVSGSDINFAGVSLGTTF